MRLDFSDYTFKSRTELLDRYSKLISELANSNIELSTLLQSEHRERYMAWQQSEESSINGRDREATIATLHLSTEIHKVRGEIIALQNEKGLIEFLIKEGVHLDG